MTNCHVETILFLIVCGPMHIPCLYFPGLWFYSFSMVVLYHYLNFFLKRIVLADKTITPKAINDVKLIHAGKILEDNKTLADSRITIGDLPCGVITMHVVVQPPVAKKKKGNTFSVSIYRWLRICNSSYFLGLKIDPKSIFSNPFPSRDSLKFQLLNPKPYQFFFLASNVRFTNLCRG